MLRFFTDGGYSIPKDVGGWGLVLIDDTKTDDEEVRLTLNGVVTESTSNRMELTAFLTALEYMKENLIAQAEIITDSNYVVQGYNNWSIGWKAKGWRKADGKPIKNKDLWEAVDKARLLGAKVTWTKGHNLKAGTKESYYNDMVDKLTRDYE